MEDRWILSRLHRTIAEVTTQIDEFKFSEPINAIYKFFWNELCDWYLELIKPRMWDDNRKGSAQRVLAYVLDCSLRLLHPFLPYITEGIYQHLNTLLPDRSLAGIASISASDTLVSAQWPIADEALFNTEVEEQLAVVQGVISRVRELRTQYQVPPKNKVEVTIKAADSLAAVINAQNALISKIANIETLNCMSEITVRPAHAAVSVGEGLEVFVHDVVDVEAEKNRLLKQKETLEKGIKSLEGKLGNENFVARAKPEVVEKERQRMATLQDQLNDLLKNLESL